MEQETRRLRELNGRMDEGLESLCSGVDGIKGQTTLLGAEAAKISLETARVAHTAGELLSQTQGVGAKCDAALIALTTRFDSTAADFEAQGAAAARRVEGAAVSLDARATRVSEVSAHHSARE